MASIEQGRLPTEFLATLSENARQALASEPELETWLAVELPGAVEPLPHLTAALPAFVDHLVVAIEGKNAGRLESRASFRTIDLPQLFHAWACTLKDERALASFEALYFDLVDRTFRRMNVTPTLAADLRSELREEIFFGRGTTAPAIAGYSGRGGLRSWTRAVAVHAVLNARRTKDRDVELDETTLDVMAPEMDPELSYLKRRYSTEFEQALTESFTLLEPQERNLLRQYYLDGLTIDALGRLHRVHRATAARRVIDAREALLARMREALAAKLGLRPSEFDSLIKLVRSQLELTIRQLLQPTA